MKIDKLMCDLCGLEIYHSESSYHLPRKWHWHGGAENSGVSDICGTCYRFIGELQSNEITAFRKVWDIYTSMCVYDMGVFEEKLLKLAKKTDRYFNESKISLLEKRDLEVSDKEEK